MLASYKKYLQALKKERYTQVVYLAKGDIENAEKTMDQISGKSSSPYLLYVAGVVYKYLSDFLYFGVDYNLKGFMEQNAEKRELSSKYTSKSKEYFYKALSSINQMPEPKGELATFVKALILTKLERYEEAKKAIGELEDKKGELWEYASMVYGVETNSKDAGNLLGIRLAKADINAYYYLAKYFAKNGKAEEAKALLDALPRGILLGYWLAKEIELSKDNYI